MSDDKVVEFRRREPKPGKPRIFMSKEETIYNIVDQMYFHPGHGMKKIVAVLIFDVRAEYYVAYMGTGTDAQLAARWGAKLPRHIAEAIFNRQFPDYKKY